MKVRIFLLFVKNLTVGHLQFFGFKISKGLRAYHCTDSETGDSEGDESCYEQCFFCKTSTNTSRGLKFLDRKTKKFHKLGKWVK